MYTLVYEKIRYWPKFLSCLLNKYKYDRASDKLVLPTGSIEKSHRVKFQTTMQSLSWIALYRESLWDSFGINPQSPGVELEHCLCTGVTVVHGCSLELFPCPHLDVLASGSIKPRHSIKKDEIAMHGYPSWMKKRICHAVCYHVAYLCYARLLRFVNLGLE